MIGPAASRVNRPSARQSPQTNSQDADDPGPEQAVLEADVSKNRAVPSMPPNRICWPCQASEPPGDQADQRLGDRPEES